MAERTLEVATIQPPQATYMNMTRRTFTDCYKLFTSKVEKVANYSKYWDTNNQSEIFIVPQHWDDKTKNFKKSVALHLQCKMYL